MKKTDAINKLIEIKAIVNNFERNDRSKITDIAKLLGDVQSTATSRGRPPMRVCVNGVTYSSVTSAAAAFSIHPMTVRNRCFNPSKKFKNWAFVYTP